MCVRVCIYMYDICIFIYTLAHFYLCVCIYMYDICIFIYTLAHFYLCVCVYICMIYVYLYIRLHTSICVSYTCLMYVCVLHVFDVCVCYTCLTCRLFCCRLTSWALQQLTGASCCTTCVGRCLSVRWELHNIQSVRHSLPQNTQLWAFAHGVIGHLINSSWCTVWAISCSRQCSMGGVTKTVVCAILPVGWSIQMIPCC